MRNGYKNTRDASGWRRTVHEHVAVAERALGKQAGNNARGRQTQCRQCQSEYFKTWQAAKKAKAA